MNVPAVLPRAATSSARRPRSGGLRSSIVRHAILIVLGAIVAYPFYFLVSSSLKPFFEAIQVPPTVIPQELRPENYAEAWNKAPWPRYFANTLFIASVITIGELVTAVLAAYAFARISFKGKAILFTILLATYMMPSEATLIPSYVMMSKPLPGGNPFFPILRLGIYDTYQAQILPFLTSAVAIFLLRQQFLSVPKELHDAAVIDGAGHVRFLWSVVLPISVPALVTVAILSFYGSWNAFQWPLIVTSSPDIQPVQIGFNAFRAEAGSQYHLLMAAAAFVVAPIVLLYLVGQRYLVQGVARTGIRG